MESINSLLDQLPANEEVSVTSFRLSVLVTVFNERHLVEPGLRRVLALDHKLISSLEVIVVDDGSTDGSAEVLRRLAAEDSRISLTDAGFRIEKLFDFNRFSVPGWWFNGKVLRKKKFSRVQLKVLNSMMPIMLWPWGGLSIVAIAVRP